MIHTLSAPVLYSLELTPACNNRCPGCYNVFIDDKQTRRGQLRHRPLNAAQWATVLDQIAPHASRIKLTGGEATLHPDFAAIVRAVADRGIEFSLFTNGRWLQPEILLDFLAAAPQLTGLVISLHGHTAATHELFSGVAGSFAETVANIRLAVARGIPVTTSTVLTQANQHALDAIMDLALALGARHVTFNRYLGAPLPSSDLSKQELIRAVNLIDRLKAAGRPAQFGICVPQCLTPNSSSGCLAGVAYATVDPWGNLRPCNHSYLLAGNLLKQSLEAAWHSHEMQAFREAVPAQCHECGVFSTCHGGCRAVAMELGLEKDPLIGDAIPLHAAPRTPAPLKLHPDMKPEPRYRLRVEQFGFVLLAGNAVVSLRPDAQPLLAAFNGKTTLRTLAQDFGQPALSLVGTLYQKGLLALPL